MKTREATEFLKAEVCCPTLLTMEAEEYCSSENNKIKVERFEGKVDEVIALLQRGEKFEKMWEKVEMKFKTLHTDYESGEKYYTGVIKGHNLYTINFIGGRDIISVQYSH